MASYIGHSTPSISKYDILNHLGTNLNFLQVFTLKIFKLFQGSFRRETHNPHSHQAGIRLHLRIGSDVQPGSEALTFSLEK